jgi:hypothetical protein
MDGGDSRTGRPLGSVEFQKVDFQSREPLDWSPL